MFLHFNYNRTFKIKSVDMAHFATVTRVRVRLFISLLVVCTVKQLSGTRVMIMAYLPLGHIQSFMFSLLHLRYFVVHLSGVIFNNNNYIYW